MRMLAAHLRPPVFLTVPRPGARGAWAQAALRSEVKEECGRSPQGDTSSVGQPKRSRDRAF